jgi:hypothetical protein
MSKSAVTAGLIGGRVGNKGGVGISLNIDGTTLLFLNAHLAGSPILYLFRRAAFDPVVQHMKAKSTIASQIWPKSKYPNLLEVDVISLTFLSSG